MEDVVVGVRAGGGPVVVEAATYRWHGHYEGDPQRYRSPEEVRDWADARPARRHERRLRDAGVGDDEIKALEAAVAGELDDAVEAARRLASPAAATLHDFVVRAAAGARRAGAAARRTRRCSARWTRSAPRSRPSSTSDDRVFVAGIDVGAGGNVFGLTRGLHDRFGDRGAGHADLGDGDHGPRRRRGDGRDAARWSSSCTSTSSASASTSCSTRRPSCRS